MTDAVKYPPIKPRPEFAGILRVDEQFSSPEPDAGDERLNGWFDRLMLQSGIDMPGSMLLWLSICGMITFGGLGYVIQEHLLVTGLGAAFGGVLPIGIAMFARYRRQKKMLDQFPPMIGELARAARTGRSLAQCLEVVAADTPSPLGDELKRSARKLQMGLPVGEAVRDLPERTGLVSANVLVTALSVHEHTGGDLVYVLDRLSRTVRDRITFLGRLRAATTASRWTAIMMIGLPALIVAFFVSREPDYLSTLLASKWGLRITMLAVALQVVGTISVIAVLRGSRRT